MQLGHRNVLRSPGRLALGCATILIRVRAPPQRRHSNRLTAGSFVALTSIPPRSEVIDSSPVVLLRSTTFTMRYSVAALLMIARQLSESSFASAWSGPVMVKVRPSSTFLNMFRTTYCTQSSSQRWAFISSWCSAQRLACYSNTEPSRLDHRVLVRMSSNPAVPKDDRGNQ